MKISLITVFSFFVLSASAQQDVPASIYNFKVAAQNGGTIDFSQFRGKKILIVNTPSEADNNPNYNELEALSTQYKDKVVVIGFLDNDFLTPPGSKKNPAIVDKNYPVSFPLAAKVLVRTNAMSPVYKWLTQKKYNKLQDSQVKWDFQKYLIDEQGNLVAVFSPNVKPRSPEMIAAISK